MRRSFAVLALSFLAACAADTEDASSSADAVISRDGPSLATTPGGGFAPGLVTGRIYDDLVKNTDARMDDFVALGVRALRIEIENTTPLSSYARIVKAAQARGIDVLAIIGQNSVPGSPDPMKGTRASFDEEYVPKFIGAIDAVTKAIPSLRNIEVWNEPDVYGFTPMYSYAAGVCRPLEGAQRFALLTVRVFETLSERRKKGIATPTIATFSFSRQDDACLRTAVFDAQPIASHRKYYRAPNGMKDGLPTDVVAIHAYGNAGVLPGEKGYTYQGGTFDDGVSSFLDARFRDGARVVNGNAVWYTEVGFCRGRIGGTDPRGRQATAVSRALGTMKAHPEITAAFVYSYRDDEPGGSEQCGLRQSSRGGYAVNPAYAAFRDAAR